MGCPSVVNMSERMDEGTTRTLRNLGLSSYEARVYISLVRNGALTASEVSSQSRIPFSRVYDVLAALNATSRKAHVKLQKRQSFLPKIG
jgi:predicted transcriptional regulator